ncbi:MAG: FAD-dependent oxidoreductase [Acidimicrobiales bacterium]
MARIVVIGAGMAGLSVAMMLADDGHRVTALERDPQPPPDPGQAWESWTRRGVNQFRLPHFLMARFRQVAEAELPGLVDDLKAAGALPVNSIARMPDDVTGGPRPGDDRFELVTARRPVVEAVVAARAAATDGLTVHRGCAVAALQVGEGPGPAGRPVHVTGVVTAAGETIPADLVIDCSGRRTAVPALLRAVGSPGPQEEIHDSGFVYYGRHFRSGDGSLPRSMGPGLQSQGSVSTLTLPGDGGTWAVVVVASGRDGALRALRRLDVWEQVVRAMPRVAHWLDGEAIDDVTTIAGIEDARRHYVPDGQPVATGIVPLADAWSCTNPSLGRGVSLGLTHAGALRSLLRQGALDEPAELPRRWAEATAATTGPYVDETLRLDGHRLAEIEATIEGRPYEVDDPIWNGYNALQAGASQSPDLLRASLDVTMLFRTVADVLADPDLGPAVAALDGPGPADGPDRAELLSIVGA